MAFRGERLFPVEEVFVPYDAPTGKLPTEQIKHDDIINGQLELFSSITEANYVFGIRVVTIVAPKSGSEDK